MTARSWFDQPILPEDGGDRGQHGHDADGSAARAASDIEARDQTRLHRSDAITPLQRALRADPAGKAAQSGFGPSVENSVEE